MQKCKKKSSCTRLEHEQFYRNTNYSKNGYKSQQLLMKNSYVSTKALSDCSIQRSIVELEREFCVLLLTYMHASSMDADVPSVNAT